MNLEVLSKVDPSEWDNQVIKLYGNCFHCYKWIQYSSRVNNSTPLFFQLYDDSNTICAISFGLLSGRKIAGIPVFTSLSFGSFPASENNDTSQVMIQNIIDYSKHNKIVTLSFSSFGTPFGNDILNSLGFTTQKKWEFVLDIEKTADELWDELDSTKRRSIRRGRKNELVVSLAQNMDEVLQFRNLAVKTYDRKTEQGISYPKAPPETYYQTLKNKLIDEGIGKLYLAYDEGQVVAGVFIIGFNKQSYYMLSSSNDIGLKKSAPDLIIWNSIVDFIAEGYSMFNLGGLSETELDGLPLEQAGLYRFKQKYSAEVIAGCKGNLVLKPKTFQLFSFYRIVKNRFKQLLSSRP